MITKLKCGVGEKLGIEDRARKKRDCPYSRHARTASGQDRRSHMFDCLFTLIVPINHFFQLDCCTSALHYTSAAPLPLTEV